jgi:hypothetical protein
MSGRRESSDVQVEEIIDRLYGLPLAGFTTARNDAARELRTAGQREAAERVKALRKPTAAAGAVNRLVREHRAEVEQFLRAAAALRDAQFSGAGDLAATTRQEHEALDCLIGLGGEGVRQTLLAAAVDDDAAEQLLGARLEREIGPRGFGSLLVHSAGLARVAPSARPAPAKPAQSKPTPAPPDRTKPDDGAARAKLQEAKAGLGAAEAEEEQARRHWEQTRRDLEKARSAVEEARGDLDRLHHR